MVGWDYGKKEWSGVEYLSRYNMAAVNHSSPAFPKQMGSWGVPTGQVNGNE